MSLQNNSRIYNWDNVPEIMTMPVVAKVLGCSLTKGYGLLNIKSFPHYAVCNRVYVDKRAFCMWIEEQIESRRCSTCLEKDDLMVKEASEKEEIRVGKGDIPQGLIS